MNGIKYLHIVSFKQYSVLTRLNNCMLCSFYNGPPVRAMLMPHCSRGSGLTHTAITSCNWP